MAPKKAKPLLYPEGSGVVDGWPWKVRGYDGMVTVGTAGSGMYQRFTFYLKHYEGKSNTPAECVQGEIIARNEPDSKQMLRGIVTPTYGPLHSSTVETSRDPDQPSSSMDCAPMPPPSSGATSGSDGAPPWLKSLLERGRRLRS